MTSTCHGRGTPNSNSNGVTVKLCAFTGESRVPSARFRVHQYIPELRRLNIDVTPLPCRVGKYPPVSRYFRMAWALALLGEQTVNVVKSRTFDVTLLQREIVPTYYTLEGLTKRPRLLDVDDAIFTQREGNAARSLARAVDHIICGNAYLANWFQTYNRNVSVIPTGVDTDRFMPRQEGASKGGELVIGWVGTSGNLKELLSIEEGLAQVMALRRDVRLKVVCDRRPTFRLIPQERVDYVRWSVEAEVSDLQEIDVGIMPLRDTEWTRGKCSFKLLQYMACGIPVVASPVGMNQEVLALGDLGMSARTTDEWIGSLLLLLNDDALRKRLGGVGRRVVVEKFAVRVLAKELARTINRLHG